MRQLYTMQSGGTSHLKKSTSNQMSGPRNYDETIGRLEKVDKHF